MQTNHLISVNEFCVHHHIDITFVHLLEQRGLVETVSIERSVYVQPEQLSHLEKLVRLHQELAIHPDDLDVVTHLLDHVETLQDQLTQLRNRLIFYEQVNG